MKEATKSNTDYYALSVEETLQILESSASGLSATEVAFRQQRYGKNEIPDARRKQWWRVALKQFKSLMVLVLVLAAILSFLTGNYVDVYIIIVVILIDATIGFVQEWRAEGAVSSLQKMLSPVAKVIRDNSLQQVNASNLVPGDLIVVEEGDHIAADARLIESKNLRTNEASLTGESLPAQKSVTALPVGAVMADQFNMLRKGTFAIGGFGKAVVTGIGFDTEIGKVARSLQSIEVEKSHFQQKIDKLATQMGLASVLAAVVFFFVGYFSMDLPFNELLLIAVAAMVSIIPEGLPSIIAIVLAIGARRMTKRKAIVRELTTTETLGAVTTIITDKTGTLTENALTARHIALLDEGDITVSGEGWASEGNFSQGHSPFSLNDPTHPIHQLLEIAAVSTNASLRYSAENKSYDLTGDPTEGALLVLARKAGVEGSAIQKLDDLPFDSSVKFRATLYHSPTVLKLLVVGAPERLIERSKQALSKEGIKPIEVVHEKLTQKMNDFATASMRVIALAYKDMPAEKTTIDIEDVQGLTFVGLVAMFDPPREEVKAAVLQCKQAGIRVIMATGDHVGTALSIARAAGIIPLEANDQDSAMTEDQLLSLSQEDFDKTIGKVNVFARLTPQTKLKIASRLQALGELIAMTGDGVNDAPAIKKADVGIAMGIMGTDVARDAAKLVLADDNFATIVHAVEEGRVVFNNARQASFYLITTNLAEIITLVVAILLGLPMPLTAIQILWLNLVTDGMGDMAIAAERSLQGVMKEKPLARDAPLLSKSIIPFIMINVFIMTVLATLAYHYYLLDGLSQGRSAVFIVMSFTQLFNMYNMRSLRQSVFAIGVFSNRFVSISMMSSVVMTILIIQHDQLNRLFGFESIQIMDFAVLVLLSSLVLWAGEAYKYLAFSRKIKSMA